VLRPCIKTGQFVRASHSAQFQTDPIICPYHLIGEELAGIGGRAETQEKIVTIWCAVVEWPCLLVSGRRASAGITGHPRKGLHELKGTAGMMIVTEELVLWSRFGVMMPSERDVRRPCPATPPSPRRFPTVRLDRCY